MLKRIGLKLAEEVANHTGDVVALITFIVWFLYTRDRVLQDKSPAAVIIIVSFLLYLPLFYAVFYILMLIPKFVCMTILLIIDKKNRYRYGHTESNDKEFERFWREEDEAYEDMNREQKEREEKERQNEHAWQSSYESWKRTYEQYRSQQEQNYQNSYNKNHQQNSSSQEKQNQAGHKKDELHDALSFYGLIMPFTQEQLKEKRRKLMKTAHPDEGGDTETAANINRYFDILKKYAT